MFARTWTDQNPTDRLNRYITVETYYVIDTKYFCDRCSERIAPGDRTSYQAKAGARRHEPPLDFCSECLAALLAWLGPGPGRVREVAIEPVAEVV